MTRALVFAILVFAAACGQPTEPNVPAQTESTNPCWNPPWMGSAKLGPTNAQGGYYVFAIPQSDPFYTYEIDNNMFLNYFTGWSWQNTCLWQNPFGYTQAGGGQTRFFDSMFYIWGTYAEIWLKVLNSPTQQYECWNLSLDQNTRALSAWSQWPCGLMDLDSYSGAIWSTPVYN